MGLVQEPISCWWKRRGSGSGSLVVLGSEQPHKPSDQTSSVLTTAQHTACKKNGLTCKPLFFKLVQRF